MRRPSGETIVNRPALLIALVLLPLSLSMPSASAVCIPERSFPNSDIAIPAVNTPGVSTPGVDKTLDLPPVGPVDVGPVPVGVPSVTVEPTHRDRQVLVEEDFIGTQETCIP